MVLVGASFFLKSQSFIARYKKNNTIIIIYIHHYNIYNNIRMLSDNIRYYYVLYRHVNYLLVVFPTVSIFCIFMCIYFIVVCIKVTQTTIKIIPL